MIVVVVVVVGFSLLLFYYMHSFAVSSIYLLGKITGALALYCNMEELPRVLLRILGKR